MLIDAALLVGHERIAERGHIDDVRIRRVHADGGDLADVAQSNKGPGLARIGGLIDAPADRDIAADLRDPVPA